MRYGAKETWNGAGPRGWQKSFEFRHRRFLVAGRLARNGSQESRANYFARASAVQNLLHIMLSATLTRGGRMRRAAESPEDRGTRQRERANRLPEPPPMRLLTVEQTEEAHPALKGRLRQMIHRADADDPDFRGLRRAIVRIGRSVFVDEVKFRLFLYERSALPPAPSRR